MMAGIVYLTRMGGYFVGLQLRHIKGIQPVLEALPGCAFHGDSGTGSAPGQCQRNRGDGLRGRHYVAQQQRGAGDGSQGWRCLLFGGPYLDAL